MSIQAEWIDRGRYIIQDTDYGYKWMTIIEAMQMTIEESKASGKRYYLYKDSKGYKLSSNYYSDWLFQVYPGGRQILSGEGDKMVRRYREERAID